MCGNVYKAIYSYNGLAGLLHVNISLDSVASENRLLISSLQNVITQNLPVIAIYYYLIQ